MSRFTQALVTAAASSAGITTGEPRAATRTPWRDIHATARRGAGALARRGLEPGGAVAILAGLPIDVAPAAQAVWLAGGSVTMLHQPTPRTDLAQYAADTLAVLSVIGARIVIVGDPFTDVAAMIEDAGFVAVTVAELRAAEDDATPVDAGEDTTALLQLTSGSTAAPKAVRITHGNLWANIDAMARTAELDPDTDVMVSWLPLFHDMGMVGFLTVPMCRGIELVKVTPADFLASPLLWAELIGRHRGTVTAAPNFAYALAARVLPRASTADLDLSSLRFALNGAEPIDVAAVQQFLAAGAPYGLRETAIVPAYGMAEATLAVSFHPWGTPMTVDTIDAVQFEHFHRAVPVAAGAAGGAGDGPTDAVRSFPLLGPPLPGIEVAVRGDGGRECGDREVGVLLLRGEAITDEYLTVDGPRPTRGEDGWLDTGDLGYLVDGAVVVCGRVKDVIIMGGRNIYPTDIERIAQGVDGVRAGNAAAIRLEAGERRESFAVVVESRLADDDGAAKRIAEAVRSAVTSAIGARPALVRVVPAGTLPKTPSGKIRRAAAARLLI